MPLRRLALAAFALVLFTTPMLRATSLHTWVSGTGNDTNLGTRTSPYATFATAVTNTTAGGLISVLDPGDFGPVIITKAITIDGGAVGGTVTIGSGGTGINVAAGAADFVVLRHLTVNGLGVGSDGISYSSAASLVIEDCNVEAFTTFGIILTSASAQNLVLRNTTVTGGNIGIRIFQGAGPTQVSLRNVTISGASSAGLFNRSGLTEISDSVITQNAAGLLTDSGGIINIANSVITYNTIDAQPGVSSPIYIDPNNILFANNGTGGGGGTPLNNHPTHPKSPAIRSRESIQHSE